MQQGRIKRRRIKRWQILKSGLSKTLPPYLQKGGKNVVSTIIKMKKLTKKGKE